MDSPVKMEDQKSRDSIHLPCQEQWGVEPSVVS